MQTFFSPFKTERKYREYRLRLYETVYKKSILHFTDIYESKFENSEKRLYFKKTTSLATAVVHAREQK